MVATPRLVDALIDGDLRALLSAIGLMLLPYLSTRLDPTLRGTYRFAYLRARDASDRRATPSPRPMRRAISNGDVATAKERVGSFR
jgi:hypothetical protein